MKKINLLQVMILLAFAMPSLQVKANGYYPPPEYFQQAYLPPAHFPQAYHPAHYAAPPAPFMMPYGGYYPAYPGQHAPPAAKQPAPKKPAPNKPAATSVTTKKALPETVKLKPAKQQKSTAAHKQLFIEKLLPYIKNENAAILEQRDWLINAFQAVNSGQAISSQATAKINALIKKYRLKSAETIDKQTQQALLAKVDIIPASLTLAQAANESAWGKSRFAREANNLFGIWTYDPDKGLKPKNRDKDKKHFVRKFDDIGQSVRYYMHMLNSHPAYAKLRQIRQKLRDDGKQIQGSQLAQGLEKYSAKGETYITLIVQLITQNQWASLDTSQRQA